MQAKTGFVYHNRFLEHDTGQGHPERAERLTAITKHLQEVQLWQKLKHLMIDDAAEEWVLKAHSIEHLRYVRQACHQNLRLLDQGDTFISEKSYEAALLASGGVLAAVDAVINDILQNAFCAVRPPGHHAERNKAMGFCLFNNIAIAARYAQYKYGIQRIVILDWDVHHGNGTQDIFYDDKSVFYISTHQYPFYPGTGSRSESGNGAGEGYNLNIPMFAGSGDEEFQEAFRDEILPAIENYHPDLILISAGFDAHRDDPLANLNLTEESYAIFTSMITEVAAKVCSGRIISILEGGYNLKALAHSVEAHINKLMD